MSRGGSLIERSTALSDPRQAAKVQIEAALLEHLVALGRVEFDKLEGAIDEPEGLRLRRH